MKAVTIALAVMVILFLIGFQYAYAEENAFHKLGRGLVNAASGCLEIPKNIHDVSVESNPVEGITYGTIKGTGMALIRTGAGVIDTATFVLPEYDKLLVEPEFVYSKK